MWTQSYTRSYIPTMSDLYQGFTSSPIGKQLTKMLGLPQPTKLERYAEGAPLVDGTVAVGGRGRLADSLVGVLDSLGIAAVGQTVGDATLQGARLRRHRAHLVGPARRAP